MKPRCIKLDAAGFSRDTIAAEFLENRATVVCFRIFVAVNVREKAYIEYPVGYRLTKF